MKTMKFLTVAAFLGATMLTSCGKYDEGPNFSMRTKKARISRDWDIKEFVDPNGNSVADNSDDVVTFEKNGDYSYTSGSTSHNGKWEFSSNKEKVTVTYDYGSVSTSEQSTIMRLTSDELWVKDSDGNITKLEAK